MIKTLIKTIKTSINQAYNSFVPSNKVFLDAKRKRKQRYIIDSRRKGQLSPLVFFPQ